MSGPQQTTATASNLTEPQRVEARGRAVQAAQLALAHKSAMQYTEGAQRWQGIADRRDSSKGEFPTSSDCSSFVTWCLWNALLLPFQEHDVVNGASWESGYTGTMLEHGVAIPIGEALPGDCVIYGTAWPGVHTALLVETAPGTPQVISHGGPTSPDLLDYDYRPDVFQVRRYI